MNHTLLRAFAVLSVSVAAAHAQRMPAPVRQSATIDIASAVEQRYRAMIEPLVFGRFSLGLSGEYTTEPNGSENYILYPAYGCTVDQLCAPLTPTGLSAPCCGYDYFYGSGEKYRAWSFNLHARWYPEALSLRGDRQSAAVFVGEFIGYHQRRSRQAVYYGCAYCGDLPPPRDSGGVRPDSAGFVPPDPYYGGPNIFTQKIKGWEPGVEFGVRVSPTRHMVMDVGGQFRLVRIEDYQSGLRPGDIDKRLLVTIGVGW
jgi:hypothetical protein